MECMGEDATQHKSKVQRRSKVKVDHEALGSH